MPSTEAPISINLKSPNGTGITLRAESAEEFADMVAQGIHVIADAVKEVESAIRASTPPSTTTAPMSTEDIANQFGATVVSNSVGDTPSPVGGRNCPHGRMTAIQGMGKDGKPYKGYFCAAPKGAFDKCKNQYIYMTDSGWNTFVPDSVK